MSWDVVSEVYMRLSEGNVREFQRIPTKFRTMDEKDDVDRIAIEVEPLLGASGYRTRRSILMIHGEYPGNCLAQTLWYPKRGNLVGRGGVVLHRVARPKSTSVNCGG